MAEEQSVKVQVRGFDDPLVGTVWFEAFDNPNIALEKLRERQRERHADETRRQEAKRLDEVALCARPEAEQS